MGWLTSKLLGMSPMEATAERRGFPLAPPAAQKRLETAGATFLQGYNLALRVDDLDLLGYRLEEVEPELRGFAYEGAAMALTILDSLTRWSQTRFRRFLAGPGAAHLYMLFGGGGGGLARLRRPATAMLRLNPLLGWLAVDGYGFHQGYFYWKRYFLDRREPERVSGPGRQVFDQGLGRSLWFVEGARVERVAAVVNQFRLERRADLWSGIGLACAYAGGASRPELEQLCSFAGPYLPELAQGVSFAAKARQRAGNLGLTTETACQVICGVSAAQAAATTDAALDQLPANGPEPAYAIWRQRIHAQFREA